MILCFIVSKWLQKVKYWCYNLKLLKKYPYLEVYLTLNMLENLIKLHKKTQYLNNNWEQKKLKRIHFICSPVESVRSNCHLSDTLRTHISIDLNEHLFIIQFSKVLFIYWNLAWLTWVFCYHWANRKLPWCEICL